MHPRDDRVALPARAFVLGDGLDVGVSRVRPRCGTRGRTPQRLHLLLAGDAGDTAAIAVHFDLPSGGMSARVDRGPVTVWPCWDDDVSCLGLRGPRHAVVELPRPALAHFLADVAAPAGILRQRNH